MMSWDEEIWEEGEGEPIWLEDNDDSEEEEEEEEREENYSRDSEIATLSTAPSQCISFNALKTESNAVHSATKYLRKLDITAGTNSLQWIRTTIGPVTDGSLCYHLILVLIHFR